MATQSFSVVRPTRYTSTAVVLHWLIGLLIICGFVIGWYAADLPVSPQRVRDINYHKWIGITVLALVLVRLGWRLGHRPPADLPMPRWQALAAHAVHWLLYVLMLAVPLFGWLYSSAKGFPVVYLKLWQLPDLVSKNEALARQLKGVHVLLAWTLGAVVLLHLAAALKHHFVDRDATLARMMPWHDAGKIVVRTGKNG